MHRGYLFRVRAVTIAVEIQNVKKLSRPVALGSISGGNDHGRLLFFPVGTTSVKPRDTGWFRIVFVPPDCDDNTLGPSHPGCFAYSWRMSALCAPHLRYMEMENHL